MPAAAAPPPPVTLVVGPEELLRDRAVTAVIRVSRAVDEATEVRDLSAVGLEPGTVTGLASPSLFGERKVIVVGDVQDAGEELTAELKAYLLDPADDTALVLVHTGGVKGKGLLDAARKSGAAVVDCKQVKWDSDKVKLVLAEFRDAGRKITGDAASALVDAIGSDLRELANACSQLVADTSGVVDVAVVERYHGGRVEASGFKVADAAMEGRCEDALRLLRQALATGVDPVPINAALAMGLRNLARVSSAPQNLREDELARELGLAPFMVRKARGQRAGWSPQGVAGAITAVAQADAEIKGAGTDPVYALERAVVTIARARGER
jgi:DNA polymerase III subunit delta